MGANESNTGIEESPEDPKNKDGEIRKERQHSIAMRAIGNGRKAVFYNTSVDSDIVGKIKDTFEKRHPHIGGFQEKRGKI
jgi:hypothetical protein